MSAIKFGGHLKELRLHLCQSSASSKGVRYELTSDTKNLRFTLTVQPSYRILQAVCGKILRAVEKGQPSVSNTDTRVQWRGTKNFCTLRQVLYCLVNISLKTRSRKKER